MFNILESIMQVDNMWLQNWSLELKYKEWFMMIGMAWATDKNPAGTEVKYPFKRYMGRGAFKGLQLLYSPPTQIRKFCVDR